MRTIGNPRNVIIEENGGIPVNVTDQTSPIFDIYFGLFGTDSTVTVATAVDDYTVTVANGANFTIGDWIGLIYLGFIFNSEIVNIAGNVITVSDPITAIFPVGALARPVSIHMNVDGSVTKQYFQLRKPGELTVFPFIVDVTQIMIQMITNTATELSDFGDIAGGVLNGIVLRRLNGFYQNFWNAKKNSDIAIVTNDFVTYSALNPAGTYGLAARYEMAGQSKHGAVIRLEPGDTLEVIVQDDLTDLIEFRMMAQGHAISEQDLPS